MRIKGLYPALLLTVLAASPAHADDRFGCMAEDRYLKLAVHVEFSGDLGGRRIIKKGRLGLTDPAAPEGLRDRRLTSQMETQSWADDSDVMLRLFDDETDRRVLDIALSASAASPGAPDLHGHFTIRSSGEGSAAYVHDGTLFCQRQPERTALAKMFPSEAE